MDRHLNLAEDDPEEYEGRIVVCDGAEYVIGEWIGEGAERFVHALRNRRAGLDFHFINIMRDQANAVEHSRRNAEALAEARNFGAPTSPEPMLVHGHGGVFELREAASRDPGPNLEL